MIFSIAEVASFEAAPSALGMLIDRRGRQLFCTPPSVVRLGLEGRVQDDALASSRTSSRPPQRLFLEPMPPRSRSPRRSVSSGGGASDDPTPRRHDRLLVEEGQAVDLRGGEVRSQRGDGGPGGARGRTSSAPGVVSRIIRRRTRRARPFARRGRHVEGGGGAIARSQSAAMRCSGTSTGAAARGISKRRPRARPPLASQGVRDHPPTSSVGGRPRTERPRGVVRESPGLAERACSCTMRLHPAQRTSARNVARSRDARERGASFEGKGEGGGSTC